MIEQHISQSKRDEIEAHALLQDAYAEYEKFYLEVSEIPGPVPSFSLLEPQEFLKTEEPPDKKVISKKKKKKLILPVNCA